MWYDTVTILSNAPWNLLLGAYLDSQGSFCSNPSSLLGMNTRAPCCHRSSQIVTPGLSLRAELPASSSRKPPGSPPGSKVLPGPRPRADHGGEGQGSQEGEEAEVEQPLDAIVADASKGVQVVLQEEEGHVAGRQVGAQPGVRAGLRRLISPGQGWGSPTFPHPEHFVRPMKGPHSWAQQKGFLGSLHKQVLTIYCVLGTRGSALSETDTAAGWGSQTQGHLP